jgi:hypothetical protein
MNSRRFFVLSAGFAVFLPNQLFAQNIPTVPDALLGQHPAGYYKHAITLFDEGKKNDAVFVFYLGQLRYRTHLAARPELPEDQDRAVFASLSESIGRPINEYAFGDLSQLDRTLKAVFAYDAANPDQFTPRAEFPDATRLQRDGMEKMRQYILSNADETRKQRKANGLENRS